MTTSNSKRAGVTLGVVLCAQFHLPPAVLADGPAVSAPNGKITIGAGAGDDNDDTDSIARIGGSQTLPLGNSWGVQVDASLQDYGRTTGTGALHLFTRDPDSYLLGIAASVVHSNVSTFTAVGVEAELYLGRFSLEGWAGYAPLDYDSNLYEDKDGFFALVDMGYYPTDNLRLGVGMATVLGYESLNVSGEYQLTGLPLSLTADARLGDDDATSATAGLKFYFGGEQKTLIDRHRQDDPRDRGMDLFAAAGSQVNNPKSGPDSGPVASDFTDEASCTTAGFTWVWSSPEHCS